MSNAPRRIQINTLRKRVAGEIDVNGKPHQVLQMDFGTQQSLESAEARESMAVVGAAVRKVIPTLTDDELNAMALPDMNAILTFAGAGIESVERLFPNAFGPEGQTSPA